MNIFLAGATGVIGRPLLVRLLEAGHQIVALTRSQDEGELLRSQGAIPVVADVFDRAAIHRAIIDAQPEVVINQLTSIPHTLNTRHIARDFAQTNRLRTEGTQILMEAAKAAGARQFIAQSNAAYYTPDETGLATEEQALYLNSPAAFAELVKALDTLEHIVLNTPGIVGTVLRYGHFYGSKTGFASEGSIADAVRQRQLPMIGGGNAIFSFIHVDDAVDATVKALNQMKSDVYNIVDDDPDPVYEWLPVYAKLLEAPQPLQIPKMIGHLAAGRFAVYYINEQRGVSNRKAKQKLGWQPQYPTWRIGFNSELQPGLREAVS